MKKMLGRRHVDQPTGTEMAFARPGARCVLAIWLLTIVPTGCRPAPGPTEAQGMRPSEVVKLFIDLIEEGEAQRAYALRTVEIRRELDFQAFREFVRRRGLDEPSAWEAIITIKPIRETIISSERAEVEIEYRRQGRAQTMTITCEKEDGVWKLGRFG